MADPSEVDHFTQYDIITLEVGPEKTIFRAHRKLLCDKSEFFAGCLRGNFAEGLKNKVALPEDSSDAVAAFLEWLYKGSLEIKNVIFKNHCARLYAFADKICSESYTNDLIDTLGRACSKKGIPGFGELGSISRAGLLDSKWAMLVTDWLVWHIMHATSYWLDPASAWHKEIPKFILDDNVSLHMFRAILEFQNSPPSKRPDERGFCYYHVHAEGHTCSAAGKP